MFFGPVRSGSRQTHGPRRHSPPTGANFMASPPHQEHRAPRDKRRKGDVISDDHNRILHSPPLHPQLPSPHGRGRPCPDRGLPGNSYFSARRITELAAWAAPRFTAVDFVYADLHVASVFAALGHAPEQAVRRASKELKAVRRRILGGVEAAGPWGRRIGVRALSEFSGDPVYALLHRRVRHFLATDEEFRKSCDRMVRQFLAPGSARAGPSHPNSAPRAWTTSPPSSPSSSTPRGFSASPPPSPATTR